MIFPIHVFQDVNFVFQCLTTLLIIPSCNIKKFSHF
jgi:hypothetical protein